MISPNPKVMASIVPAKPTPAASPRYSEAMTSEMTGSTLNLMISRITKAIAMAVCRTSTTALLPGA